MWLLAALAASSCDDASTPMGEDGGIVDATMEPPNPDTAAVPDMAAGGTPGSECFPSCLTELFAACWPEGMCSDRLGIARRRCFENGVKMATIGMDTFIGNGVAFVTTTDGATLCYELAYAVRDEKRIFSYKNADAIEIATIEFEDETTRKGTVTCKQSATSAPIDLNSQACADSKTGVGGETTMSCPNETTCDAPVTF